MTGAHLRARRTELGLSQGKLAEALGVPVNTIARWERGELRIERPRMLELALDTLGKRGEERGREG